MASDQMKRGEKTTIEKDRVPQLTTHFESLSNPAIVRPEDRDRIGDDEKAKDTHSSLPDTVQDKQKQPPSLDEISEFRATAQKNENELMKAAMARYDKAKERTSITGEADKSQKTGMEAAKETLATAAKTAKDYTLPIADKAKDYTIQTAVGAKDAAVSAGGTTAHYVGEKAVAAKDVAVESGKSAAQYTGKVAEDLKDKAVAAGWSTAHYSCEKAVEGTKAAARAIKGAAEYAGEIAAKPLSAAKDAAVSTGESAKEYTARKKEEAQRELKSKNSGESKEASEGSFEGRKERMEESYGGGEGGEKRDEGGLMGAIGETICEIAQETKNIVIGEEEEESEKNRASGFEIGEGGGEESKGKSYEKKEERREAPLKKEA